MTEAKILDGKKIAEHIKKEVRKLIVDENIRPGLSVLLVGEDPASKLYVSLKEKACKQVGIDFHKYIIDDDMTQQNLVDAVKFLNQDVGTDAILVQLPLPAPYDADDVIDTIAPHKDVDGYHKDTLKNYVAGKSPITPVLTAAIEKLLEETKEELSGKTALIISNSEIFSEPVKAMLKNKGVEGSWASPDDKDLVELSSRADILIVAVGRSSFITADMVKEKAIVIDIGTNRKEQGVDGDVDFEEVIKKAGWITPVPGGVGPVTVAMLLKNTVTLAIQERDRN